MRLRWPCLLATLPSVVQPAVLLASQTHRLSICVPYKAAMSQWTWLLWTMSNGTNCNTSAPGRRLLLSPGGIEMQYAGDRVLSVTGWQDFYNTFTSERFNRDDVTTAQHRMPDFRHIHVIREPLERLVSSYLDRCLKRRVSWCGGESDRWGIGDEPTLKSFRRFVRLLHTRAMKSGPLGVSDEHFKNQTDGCNSVLLEPRGLEQQGHIRLLWQSQSEALLPPSLSATASLHEQVMSICSDTSLPRSICSAAFPPKSAASHATGAGGSPLALQVRQDRLLLRDIVELYPADFKLWADLLAHRRRQRSMQHTERVRPTPERTPGAPEV